MRVRTDTDSKKPSSLSETTRGDGRDRRQKVPAGLEYTVYGKVARTYGVTQARKYFPPAPAVLKVYIVRAVGSIESCPSHRRRRRPHLIFSSSPHVRRKEEGEGRRQQQGIDPRRINNDDAAAESLAPVLRYRYFAKNKKKSEGRPNYGLPTGNKGW